MNRRRALSAFSQAIRGQAPDEGDWTDLLELANQALVTPALQPAFEASGAGMPRDAASFLALITERNDERNARLRRMAEEAVAALNAAGVTPIYLKGMAVWASCDPAAAHFPRMMSDVDLLISPDEVPATIEALTAAGFTLNQRYEGREVHVVAEFGRDGDVGMLDLHQRPPGPPGMAELFDRAADTKIAPWLGKALTPSPLHQIFLTSLHDMIHDGDYWRGGFDLRHLYDIARLARSGGVDWSRLDRLLPTRLLRNQVLSQMIAAHEIVGAEVPQKVLNAAMPRLQYRRHRLQYLYPRFGVPLAAAGIALEIFNLRQHRRVNNAGRSAIGLAGAHASADERRYRIDRILHVPPGKV